MKKLILSIALMIGIISGQFVYGQSVSITPTPSSATICAGQGIATLQANPSGGTFPTYLWLPGGETIQSINVVPSTTTSYTVIVNFSEGTSATSAVTVYVDPLPNLSISGTNNVCNGGTIMLLATTGGLGTINWTGPNGFSSVGWNPMIANATTAMNGYYLATVTNGTCIVKDSVSIAVNPVPVASISPSSANICNGGSATLTASLANSYLWSTGATTQSITVAPTTTTVYNVNVANSFGCNSNAGATVTVNPLPVATITPATASVCPGGSTTLTSSSAVSYAWSNGSITQSITVSPNVTSSYWVTVTDINGCSATSAADTVTVNPLPAPVISPSNPSICNGQSTSLTASGGTSYLWNNGTTTQSITVSPTTTTIDSVTVTNSFGCSSLATSMITVNPLPMATITPSSANICNGASVGLTAGGGVSYLWSTGATTTSIIVAPTTTTTYNVNVTNSFGCNSNTSVTVVVNALPTVSINPSAASVCPGGSTSLTASGAVSYAWSNGATTQSITVNPNLTSNYSVTVTDGNGCSATSASSTVTVNPLPAAVISPSNPSVCNGQSVSLTASGGNSYVWSTSATTNSITVAPTTTSIYSVTVINSFGCTSIATSLVTVDPLPVVSITPSAPSICLGNSVSLTASGGVSYLWGNGTTTNSITVAPTTTTTYNVNVTNSFGCNSNTSVTVVVNQLPIATITPSAASVCPGGSTSLTASGAVSYAWSNGATTQTISVNPNSTANYSVTVTDGNGCSATSTSSTITVNPLPIATITPSSANICFGGNANLVAGGGNSYLWSTGGTNNSINVTPTVSTVYTVTVINSFGCLATASVVVTVNSLPTVIVTPGGATTFCQGSYVTLTAGGANTYVWSTGASGNSINAFTTGIYYATGTDANGCSASSVPISIVASPVPANAGTINGPTSACEGTNQIYTTSSIVNATSYYWAVPVGSTILSGQGTPQITLKYGTQGGAITVYGQNSLCSGQPSSLTVNANPMPSVTVIANPASICPGGSTTLTASGAISYVWSNGATTQFITISPSMTTNYSVTVTDANGCSASSAASTVTVNPIPVPVITPSAPSICNGQSTTLTASGGATYLWNTGATTTSINVAPTVNTTYTVTATNSFGCTNTASYTVTANPSPIVVIVTGSTTFCPGGSTTLIAAGTGVTYQWFMNGVIMTTETNQNYTAGAAGTFKVIVKNVYGCPATDSITVTTKPLPTVSLSPASYCTDVNSATPTGGLPTGGYYSGTCIIGGMVVPPVVGVGTYTVLYTYTDPSTGCTNGATNLFTINPVPAVSFFSIVGSVNTSTPAFDLMLSVSPTGGNFWGTGVVTGSSFFNPATAGAGSHMITYSYTQPLTGCEAHQIQYINVGTVGINEVSAAINAVNIFPNPSSNSLNITGIDTKEIKSLKITNLLGQLMYVSKPNTDNVIDVAEYPSGMYVINFMDANGISGSKRFMKE